MRLAASASGILLACLAGACAARPTGSTSEAPSPAVDLSRERQLVEEAHSAVTAQDFATAKEKAAAAIELLLERSESERDAEWLDLLDGAGLAASLARDARAARTAWKEVLEVRSRTLPDDHPDLQTARGNLAVTIDDLGDFAAARALEEKVIEVYERTLPEDHPDLQTVRGNLAGTLRRLGDLAGARALEEQVLEVRSRTLPEDHPDLQIARANLALTLYSLGDLAGARALEERVLEVRTRTLPEDHPDLQSARGNLASTLGTLGDLEAARALEKKVLEVHARTLPEDHPAFQRARANLAITLAHLGDLPAARALQQRVFEILSRTLPEDHPDLQAARGNLADTLRMLGHLAAARALEEKVLEVRARTLPDDFPDLQVARSNLAITLRELGDLAAARALQEKVLEVYARTRPDDHPDLQVARGNLAVTLHFLGDFAAARALEEKTLEVCSRTLPEDHPHLQSARAMLASTLTALGDFAAARALLERVLEVCSRTLPEDHPDLQIARGNLAIALDALGDFQAAHALLEQVLEVRSRTLPGDHHDLQLARSNLAHTLRRRGDLAAARTHFEKVLEVRSHTLPEDHPDLQAARGNLALTLAAERAARGGREDGRDAEEEARRKEFALLSASFTRAIAASARDLVLNASSREAEERCGNSLDDLGLALSFAEGLGVFERDPELEREVFVLSEETRGAALAAAHLARRASTDPDYGELRDAMRSASDELARLTRQGAEADDIDRARRARDGAERELARLARELSGGESGVLEFDPAALSASLTEREALVGYRRYPRSAYEPGGRIRLETVESLCAFVLRSDNRLARIELGAVEPIDRAVNDLRQTMGPGGGRGLGVDEAPSGRGRPSMIEGGSVRSLIFDPLLPALEGADRIVVALDDLLNVVALDALPLEQGLLGDRWRIETRSTLSELSWNSTPVPPEGVLVALGAASFDLPPLAFEKEESSEERVAPTREVSSLLRGGAWEAGFAPLDETGPEARGIAALYGEAFDKERPAFVLEIRKASRASLAELAPNARFLHVATHGWFAPESVRSMAEPKVLDAKMDFGTRMSGEERARGMSPMLLCGLALAGANLPDDELGRAPGLITAEELSTLDLTGCELAVLSACDTNVGERRAGQGVASLQKALHMAGARTVITSLWKVPDEATRELMLDFYRRIWIEKKPKGVALWEAKQKIRDAKDERGKPLYSTRDWAAWVITGDPR